ncbi:MAG: TrkH family potassium uptake protein [Melioribacteraceae bacterium]|nr:TrkH family potassium uptake protein [Melioribacteraceae bacterium]
MTKKITPVQTLLLGYVAIILSGAMLLCAPFASTNGQGISFLDALFTSASAVSTTGLVVVDTGTQFSVFGQVLIMILIQIGGLGYMIFFALIAITAGYKFSINGKQLFNESISRPNNIEIKKFVKVVLIFTLTFEFFGVAVLTIIFLDKLNFVDAAYSALFHSISAFCTAGFSLYADSFTVYSKDLAANIIVAIITIAGGIGFFVLYDLYVYFRNLLKGKKPLKLSAHTKLVLSVTFLLIIAGTMILFFSESGYNGGLSVYERFLNASFQTISASSTTGFNSVDIGHMQVLSLLIIIILMFIGASPGSTGGGIKTSTFGIVILFLKKIVTNRREVSVFKHTIGESTVNKALAIAFMSLLYLITVIALLLTTEIFSILQIALETSSALGTVGLSMGITPSLSATGKIIITITMILGRVGSLAIGYSLIGRTKTIKYTYPGGNVMTG